MTDSPHITVLLHEAVAALVGDDAGVYVDGTFGRGGHSREILSKLSGQGRLLAIDKDPVAVTCAETLAEADDRFCILHGSFAQLQHRLREQGLEGKVDGVLLDLGVSSPQLDEPQRGFSFMQDGPLDMRMNTAVGETAAQWLNRADEQDIARVLKEYGEERYARRIAGAIVQHRNVEPFATTAQLAKVVTDANPAWEKHKHPATRAFQAIRIYINNELGDLNDVLEQALAVLKPGGRLVVISFHSLEDRIVKRFIRRCEKGDPLPAGLPVMESQLNKRMRSMGKAIKPGEAEIAVNVRSRSAVMRVAEKL